MKGCASGLCSNAVKWVLWAILVASFDAETAARFQENRHFLVEK